VIDAPRPVGGSGTSSLTIPDINPTRERQRRRALELMGFEIQVAGNKGWKHA